MNKEVDEKKDFPMTRKEFKEWCSEQSKKIIEDFDCYSCYDEGIIPYRDESGYFTCLDCNDVEDTDEILDNITRDNEDMGLYDD